MVASRGWRRWSALAGFALVACGEPVRAGENSGATGSGPPVEEGEACEESMGCGVGLYCEEGTCEACGTGVSAPGKLCFRPPVHVSERGGHLSVAHLQQEDGIFADNREVHVRLLFRDDHGSLREQYFGASSERLSGALVDLDDDGFDDFVYCSIHAVGECSVSSFEDDQLVPFASVFAGSHDLDSVPAHGRFPARILAPHYEHRQWRSWLVFSHGVVQGAPLPVYPTGRALAADLDGDGTYEVVAPVDDQLVVLHLDAAGVQYRVTGEAPVAEGSELVTAVDLDGDGRDNLLLGTPQAELVVLRHGLGGGLEVSASLPLTLQPTSIAVGDVDGDGHLDLATKDQTSPAPENEPPRFDRILVLAQTEPGVFVRRYVRYPDVDSVAMFDVDRDGHTDLVVSSPKGLHHMLANP